MAKVFEVLTERDEGKEITRTSRYVTSERDSLIDVTEHFTRHCNEFEEELKSVREVLVITSHVPKGLVSDVINYEND